MTDFIPSFIAFLESSKYVLIFVGSYMEGPGVMVTTGVLWNLGIVDFLPALAALFLGDILSDIMWYTIGYHAGRPFIARYGHWFGVVPATIAKVERLFGTYQTRILSVSKLTMGFGMAIPLLVVAGMLRISFRRYVTINSLGGLVILPATMLVGYYFGNVFVVIPPDLKIVSAVGMALFFLLALRIINRKLSTLAL